MKPPIRATSGYTLLELSIVLTLVALFAGMMLAGKDLLRVAEVRAMTRDAQIYKSAVHTFQSKYAALPGDFKRATNYWGTDASCTGTPSNTVLKQATCNGDGDGYIGYVNELTATFTNQYEFFRAWQHLANAGLIEGQYTGVTGPHSSIDVIPGVNSPPPRIKQGGWYLYSGEAPAGTVWDYVFGPGTVLQFGTILDPVNYPNPAWPILTPKEQFELDSKYDDGLPGTGDIHAIPPSSTYDPAPHCATSSNPATAKYNVSNTAINCTFLEIVY